jgi:hypothetical protein
MSDQSKATPSRRSFIKTAAAGSAMVIAAPAIATAKKSDGQVITGTGDYQYEVHDQWPQLPSKFTWQTTHDVAFDSEGLLYVIHEGRLDQSDHPSIFVFDAQGKYVRSFGSQFQGGGHGLEIRQEDGQDFLYVCAYQQQRSLAKLDTKGEQLWRKGAPMQCGVYAEGEDKYPRAKKDNPWGRNRFCPTNFAFLPNGDFFLVDGYGAYRIHRYDRDGNWLSMFGEPLSKPGDRADGKFRLPHGIWIDHRGEEPLVVVADREFDRLQWFTIDGEHRRTQDGFLWPANLDVYEDLLLVPELFARVTLLNKNNEVVARLGVDTDRVVQDKKDTGGYSIRSDESKWQPGKFIHPHDACFDKEGNIFVAEWVQSGRITNLSRV